MELNFKKIGKNIKEAREAVGASQQELGNKLGLSTSLIALYESGEREINNLGTLSKIARELQVSLKELIEGFSVPSIHISFRASKKALKNPKFNKAINEAIRLSKDEFSR